MSASKLAKEIGFKSLKDVSERTRESIYRSTDVLWQWSLNSPEMYAQFLRDEWEKKLMEDDSKGRPAIPCSIAYTKEVTRPLRTKPEDNNVIIIPIKQYSGSLPEAYKKKQFIRFEKRDGKTYGVLYSGDKVEIDK